MAQSQKVLILSDVILSIEHCKVIKYQIVGLSRHWDISISLSQSLSHKHRNDSAALLRKTCFNRQVKVLQGDVTLGQADRSLILASTAELMNTTDEMGLTQPTSVKGTTRTLVHQFIQRRSQTVRLQFVFNRLRRKQHPSSKMKNVFRGKCGGWRKYTGAFYNDIT